MTTFRYDAAILQRFPTLVGGVIVATDLHNGPAPEPLREDYAREQRSALARVGAMPLSQTPSLAAWRTVFRGFGVDPTQCRSAAEALLRRLTKKGDIPSINLLVDVGNLISIRYALPVAIFELDALSGPLAVRFAEGSERYTPLGEPGTVEHPAAGEVIFADATGLVFAERWCWRQSDESAARESTTRALITVEGHHEGARADVESAMRDLRGLITTYAGGTKTWATLDAGDPAFTAVIASGIDQREEDSR
jgi:DNA/RNA-binding domain of Phe-tRNA-synthetase-like protein